MAIPENDDELRTLHVSGRIVELAEGRSVFVGWSDDGATVLKFVNNQGTETKFALHSDAACALKTLLNEGPSEARFYRLVVGILCPDAQGIDASGEDPQGASSRSDESPTPQSGGAPSALSSLDSTRGDANAG